MKQITIAGNIGKDAETRRTQGGDAITSFNVAVNDQNRNTTWFNRNTTWFGCSIWGKRGESLRQYLTKGSKVVVSGDFSMREHEGKTYLQINASEVTLMGGERREDSQSNPPPSSDLDDEIPF